MASLCKSQQCCIERRGFRQELDSWRYKLIHCVGFESILEGLFGPGLLQDLSLFKDCEPTGVCDWSFDENCLFCCLRREKVKEHLAGFHKPISESGQDNILKQEQAKIIRLERQAEEFINAVFYKKDSPRISDPNIPLVAREIMQRMIRQFAAEYTSKNSSTQDSSQANSTKNQSLPTSPSGQSSPPPATTQNPVLSKLLMADQDSPLDLTVKKPQSEEPCEQADGVLDLSTKKSPCSSSTHSGISPSTSNTIGNGTQEQENKAIDLNNSKSLTLEQFLVKLCSHHKTQFTHVLNNLSTEEPLARGKSHRPLDSDVKDADENGRSSSARKPDFCLPEFNNSASEVSNSSRKSALLLETAANSFEMDTHHSPIARKLNDLFISSDFKEDSAPNCILLQNCIPSIEHPEQRITKNNVTKSEPQILALEEAEYTKNPDIILTGIVECGVLSHNNSTLSLLNDAQDSELPICVPKIADKENTQYISPKKAYLDKDSNDCKLKQENSLQTIVIKNLENHLSHCEKAVENLQNLSDDPKFRLVRSHDNTKHLKAVKCKNTPCVRSNDHEKQCDIVYVNEPIAAECNIGNQKSFVCPRNTARKSTRGYLFGGDGCEVSTVRTLVRSSKDEHKRNCALHIAEALIIPNGMVSETLPKTDVVSMIHVGEERVEKDFFSPLPENDTVNDIIPGSPRCNIPETPLDQIPHLAKQSIESFPESLIAVISLVDDDSDKTSFPRFQPAKEQLPNGHPVEINAEVGDPLVYTKNNCVSGKECRVADSAINSPVDDTPSKVYDRQEDNYVQSLDRIVSLTNRPLSSSFDLAVELPDESSLLQATVEKVSVTSQHIDVDCSDCPSPPLLNGTGANVQGRLVPFHLGTSEPLLSNMEVTPPQESIYSEPISDYIYRERSDSDITDTNTLQPDLNSSLGSSLQKCPEQRMFKENISIKMPETVGHLNETQTVANIPDKCSLKISKNDTELETIQPSRKELNDSTPATSVDRSYTQDVNNLFDNNTKTCKKINIKVEPQDDLTQDTQQHDSVISFGDGQNYNVTKSLEAKEIKFETMTDVANFDTWNVLLVGSENIKAECLTPPKRKLKRPPAPSDRRLRSRETRADLCPQKNTTLQIEISHIPSTNATHRSVEFKNENSPCSPSYFDLPMDERKDGENCFGHFLNNHFSDGKPLFSERLIKNKCNVTCKMPENITTSVEVGSNKRKVYFATESNKDSCPFKLKKSKKRISASTANSVSCSESTIEHVPVKTLTSGIKCCTTKILKNLSKDKIQQPTRFKKSARCHSQQYDCSVKNSEFTGNGNEKGRPKFMDWCSEEDNRDRISNFNNKYMSIHKNWIPLQKDASSTTKSKNKADRLKEIWKTKKRARKSKRMKDVPRCSPVQMLFMNSLKVPDICRWFMETTETKSLVIVKQINTRIPEEHQLPMMPSQRPSKESLYPHTLQAERLKKHLKKFASVYPTCNNIKTQNAPVKLVDNDQVKLEVLEYPIARRTNVKHLEPKFCTTKPTSANIIQKDNSFRENLHSQSAPVRERKLGSVVNKTEIKPNRAQNNKKIASKLCLQTKTNAPSSKYAIICDKQTAKKRPKDVSLIKHVAQPSKKRKVETKEVFVKKRQFLNKKALARKNKVRKLKKGNLVPKAQVPKKQRAKLRSSRGAILNKTSTKTPTQKHSCKTKHAVQKCQTRSAKSRLIPSNQSRLGITPSSSQPRKNETHRKIRTISTKNRK